MHLFFIINVCQRFTGDNSIIFGDNIVSIIKALIMLLKCYFDVPIVNIYNMFLWPSLYQANYRTLLIT